MFGTLTECALESKTGQLVVKASGSVSQRGDEDEWND